MNTLENKIKRHKRANGEGSVRQDKKTGRWEAAITIGYNEKGQQKFKYFSSKTQKEALKKLNDYKEQMSKELAVEHNQITVGEWLDYWYDNYVAGKVKVKTRCDYESSARCHIKTHLGKIKLTDLKGMHIQQFYKGLSIHR